MIGPVPEPHAGSIHMFTSSQASHGRPKGLIPMDHERPRVAFGRDHTGGVKGPGQVGRTGYSSISARLSPAVLGLSTNTQRLPVRLQWSFTRQ